MKLIVKSRVRELRSHGSVRGECCEAFAYSTKRGKCAALLDVAMDIRDLAYDLTHLNEVSKVQLFLDIVAVLPVIGAIKSSDEVVGIVKKGIDSSEELTILYRAVGPNEFYDLMETGKFSIESTGRSMFAKQFGLSFEETLKFANQYSDVGAIIEVKASTKVLNEIADFTHVDRMIFKSGTVTIQADKLDDFNRIIQQLIHKY